MSQVGALPCIVEALGTQPSIKRRSKEPNKREKAGSNLFSPPSGSSVRVPHLETG